MRRLTRPALAGGFLILLVLANAVAQTSSTRVRQLAPGVFYWQGDTATRRPANCTWVVFRDYVVVIDANFPWAAKEILPEIRKTTSLPIRFLFNTHYHADHAFGSAQFRAAGATVVCSRECGAESREKGEADWQNQVYGRASRAGATQYDRDVAAETRAQNYGLEHPSLLFEDKVTFDDGTRRLELIRMGPAHSRGDAVAYLPKERILMTGDLCVNWTSGNNVGDRDADHDNWIRALETLAGWEVQTVVPGHGQLGTTATLRGQRAYLKDMLEQVRAGMKAGKSADQVAGEVDLTKHQPFGASPSAGAVRSVYRRLSTAAGR
ncbi:MAG: MBL fold metallo-hydrolase [Bryobacterales bacterium]|nr:MBL fold metallo-hydrolase [Bryobacterales bacterium]